MRAALGARPTQLLRLVFRGALVVIASGAAVGFIGMLLVSRAMTSLLVDIRPTDPASYIGAALVLCAAAALAVLVPAVRAARLEPMRILQAD